jgi:hypothetical protein
MNAIDHPIQVLVVFVVANIVLWAVFIKPVFRIVFRILFGFWWDKKL